jgi:predicted ABC-type transport system involved in lysophospholipase L1 biosynthesis ATPase subunit
VAAAALILALTATTGRLFLAAGDAAVAQELDRMGGVPILAMVMFGNRPADVAAVQEAAVVPQDLGLVDELSVAENVELPLWLAGRLDGGRAEAAELLERLGLARLGDRLPAEVSLGERQRVALARAMVVHPRLLLDRVLTISDGQLPAGQGVSGRPRPRP